MRLNDLAVLLNKNSYPGRGIVLGTSNNGKKAVVAYFIMGRSDNSRNRVFVETADGIATEAADPAKMEDPSLIIYSPVRVLEKYTIVTNGDQTDTIYNSLQAGETFEQALRQRTFEPDPPNYTPRISGMVTADEDHFRYSLSILKSAGGNAESVQRFFFEYPQPVSGTGHFISTYQSDGTPLPSFSGEPITVSIEDDIRLFGQQIWNSLNQDNKVSLFVRSIELNGQTETQIYNRYNKI